MTTAQLLKAGVALAILALVTFTTFRGSGWWWKLTKTSRVIFAVFAVAIIVSIGIFYKIDEGDHHERSAKPAAPASAPDR